MHTGMQAARLSLAGFLIPFVFVYHPAILYKLQMVFVWFGDDLPKSSAMIDVTTVTWFDLGWIVGAFAVAMWMLSTALTGYEKNKLFTSERILRVVVGLLVLLPDMSIAGPALGGAIILIIGHRYLNGESSVIDVKQK